MVCNNVDALIAGWLSGQEEQLSIFEGDHEISLRRQPGALLLSARLSPNGNAKVRLETWLRLGEASLSHFQGALAQSPENGTLWLIRTLAEAKDEQLVLNNLEQLLNQRDTWHAMVPHLARLPLKRSPTSLRSLTF